jgi:hypothetical protein
MTFTNDYNSTMNVAAGFVSAATENVRCGGDIAIVAAEVIARRMKLGAAATFHPLDADCAEFARMVPEKVEVLSAASMVMLERSGQANQQMMRSLSEEVMTTTDAAIKMTGFSNPAALVEAQNEFARAWFARTISGWVAMGLYGFGAQAAVLEPVRQMVIANAERLSR